MRNLEVVLFCAVIGCLVKFNEPWKTSNSDRDAGQEDILLIPKRSILGSSDYDYEIDDVEPRDKQSQEPSHFSPRVTREDSKIDYSECGVMKDNPKSESGYIAEVWPWMVALLDIKKFRSDEILCGGSIINEQFVLTSAICVMGKRPDELSVVLGLANRRGNDQSQQFDVKAVYSHPKFNRTNYDYDVALLELEQPIVYNPYIRPICLPTGNSNFYRPESPGLGLGFGSKIFEPASTLKRNTLKEVKLVIQHTDACKKNLGEKLARYFTQRIFCAIEESPYLCSGDGGGPVMQSEVSKDGYRIWSHVGIVSFGIGCGPPQAVGYYSHVYKLLPWIQSIANISK